MPQRGTTSKPGVERSGTPGSRRIRLPRPKGAKQRAGLDLMVTVEHAFGIIGRSICLAPIGAMHNLLPGQGFRRCAPGLLLVPRWSNSQRLSTVPRVLIDLGPICSWNRSISVRVTMFGNLFQRVSEAPTNPHAAPQDKEFDVADLYRGPAGRRS
jgi:hypothetical protein